MQIARAHDPSQRIAEFRERFERSVSRCRELWWAGDAHPPELGERFTRADQREAEREVEGLLEDIETELEHFAESDDESGELREKWRERIALFARSRLRFSPEELEILLEDEALRSTAEFAREAKAWAPQLEDGDLHQALRNVWICQLIQRLLGRKVELTPAIFAFSMLYPLTDNPLDDPDLSAAEKREVGERLGRRLEGEVLEPRGEAEAQVFGLVAKIEEQYDRWLYPEVWESVLAIHRAQIESLVQQRRREYHEVDLLGLSIAKGGASVLADGYLVAGELEPAEEALCFDFGVVLQLMDDLQDVEEDRGLERSTLFTEAARWGRLDAIAARLWSFVETFLEVHGHLCPESQASLIRRGCGLLTLHAIYEQPRYFSRRFRNQAKAFAPLPPRYLSRERRRLARLYQRAQKLLANRPGYESPFDLIS